MPTAELLDPQAAKAPEPDDPHAPPERSLRREAQVVLLGSLFISTFSAAGKWIEPARAATFAPQTAAASASGMTAQCPLKTLPDHGVCIPVPDQHDPAGAPLATETNQHTDRAGMLRSYEQIPRQADRPADYRRYRFPVTARAEQAFATSGYDLHLPDEKQRRGAGLSAVGHGGVDLAQTRGTEVRVVDLEHQVGAARVVYVGWLFGNTVVTAHRVAQGATPQEYVVIYGHLEAATPGLQTNTPIANAGLIGTVGDSGSPGDVHLHLEARRVRPSVNVAELEPRGLVDNSKTIVCDPRNVFPLLPASP